MLKFLGKYFWTPIDRRGQSMTEYIIIVVVIAVLSIGIITIFGDQIRSLFSSSAKNLAGQTNTADDQTSGADGEVNKSITDL